MSKEIRAILARNLKGIMADRRLTQPQMAKMAGMSPRTLASILTGTHSVGLDRVEALAKALRTPICDLLTDMHSTEERAQLLRDYESASPDGRTLIRLIAERESGNR